MVSGLSLNGLLVAGDMVELLGAGDTGTGGCVVLQVLPFSTLTSVLHLKDSRQSN